MVFKCSIGYTNICSNDVNLMTEIKKTTMSNNPKNRSEITVPDMELDISMVLKRRIVIPYVYVVECRLSFDKYMELDCQRREEWLKGCEKVLGKNYILFRNLEP